MFEYFTGNTSFWSPIILLWGLAIFLAGIATVYIFKRFKWTGWTNICFGIAFIILSLLINSTFDKHFWSSFLLRFSVPIFFFGITFTKNYRVKGWFIIFTGLVLLIVGYSLAPK